MFIFFSEPSTSPAVKISWRLWVSRPKSGAGCFITAQSAIHHLPNLPPAALPIPEAISILPLYSYPGIVSKPLKN
jgi:hypothetical protein